MTKEPIRPTPQMIRDLRARHQITQQQLADSLYGIKYTQSKKWESDPRTKGARNCPAIVWWAIRLTWDKVDIWNEESEE